jgi:hypothetical protein
MRALTEETEQRKAVHDFEGVVDEGLVEQGGVAALGVVAMGESRWTLSWIWYTMSVASVENATELVEGKQRIRIFGDLADTASLALHVEWCKHMHVCTAGARTLFSSKRRCTGQLSMDIGLQPSG